MEWLHQGCESDLSADLFNFGVNNFSFKIAFKKCFKIVFFSLWRFGAANCSILGKTLCKLCSTK